MVYDYIALGAAGLFMFLSLVSVITEPLLNRDKSAGRLFRRLRINLRETGFIPFLFIAGIALLVGKAVHKAPFISHDMMYVWIAVGIFAAALLILHWFRVFRPLRSKRYAHAKKLSFLSRKAGLMTESRLLREAPPARELTPLEPADPE